MSMSFDSQDEIVMAEFNNSLAATFGFDNFSPSQDLPDVGVIVNNATSQLMSPSVEETMAAQWVPNSLAEFKPISPRGPPERNSCPGPTNFTVELKSSDVHKKRFLYSTKLERMYVQMDHNFSVSFNWNAHFTPLDMYVRSTVVFADIEQSEKRVERCTQHFHESSGLEKHIAKNVLHSTREIGTEGVYYCGDADVADSWLSTVVHFKKTSSDACTHAYKFTCKNSCPSGINRRFIAVIFQLEDSEGRVYGRATVKVKVCSCPGRDMQKDEESEGVYKPGKKRVPSNRIPHTKTKKIKVESRDVEHNMVMLPQITVEVNAMVSGLRTMVDMMTNAGQHDPEVVEKYASSIAALTNYIANLQGCTTPPPPQ